MEKENPKESHFKYNLFGGEVNVIVYDVDEELVKEIMEDFYKEALKYSKIFSFFDDESELSQLNKQRRMIVSNDLLNVIKKGLAFSDITNGKYDISMGKAILARKKGNPEPFLTGSYKDIEIKNNEIVLGHEDVMIDLGSIAKGHIAEKLSEFLKDKGLKEFIIDARGDIVVSGDYEHIIDIQHPRDKKEIIGSLKLKNCGVATSGDYRQNYGSYDKSHILNSNDVISCTTITRNLTEADVCATALFVTNKKMREKIMKKLTNVSALVLTKDLKKEMYNNFDKLVK